MWLTSHSSATDGWKARRALVVAAAGARVSYGTLKEVVEPLRKEFFDDCIERRKRAFSNNEDPSEL